VVRQTPEPTRHEKGSGATATMSRWSGQVRVDVPPTRFGPVPHDRRTGGLEADGRHGW